MLRFIIIDSNAVNKSACKKCDMPLNIRGL